MAFNTNSRAVDSYSIAKALSDAGLLPPECRRIVIDINVNHAVKVYYETNAVPELLDVVIAQFGPLIKPGLQSVELAEPASMRSIDEKFASGGPLPPNFNPYVVGE